MSLLQRVIFSLQLISSVAYAALDVPLPQEGMPVGKHISYIVEDGSEFTFKEAKELLDSGKGKRSDYEIINLGLDPKTYWLKLELHSHSVEAMNLILTNLFFYTDELYVYTFKNNAWHVLWGGDAMDYSVRPIKTPSVSIPLKIDPGKNDVYIRINSQGAHQIDLRVFEEGSYWKFLFREQMFLGCLVGLHIFVSIISGFFYWSLRDKTYAFLSIHSLLNMVYNTSSIGLFQWASYYFLGLDINFPQLSLISVCLSIVTIIQFCLAYFDIKQASVSWFRWNKFLITLELAICPVLFIYLYESTAIIVVMAGVVTTSIFIQAYYFVYMKKPLSQYFAASWTGYLLASTLTAGNLVGLVPSYNYTYLWQFTFGAIQMVVLLISAVLRVNYLRNQLEHSHAMQNQLGDLVRHAQFMEKCDDPALASSYSAIASSHAAELVGGDFLGVKTEDNVAYLVIGDVNGHGMHSAMVSMIATGIIRGAISESHRRSPHCLSDVSVRNIMLSINKAMLPVRDVYDRVLTLCLIAVDLTSGRAFYSNGGHCPILIRNENHGRSLVRKGSIIGMLDSPQIPVYSLTLSPGDMILAITDGMIETKNHLGKVYSYKQLRNCLLSHRNPKEVKASIEKEQEDQGFTVRDDDASYLIFQWNGSGLLNVSKAAQ